MASHIVIDGNAFYEVDDDCINRKEEFVKRETRNKAGEKETELRGKKVPTKKYERQ